MLNKAFNMMDIAELADYADRCAVEGQRFQINRLYRAAGIFK